MSMQQPGQGPRIQQVTPQLIASVIVIVLAILGGIRIIGNEMAKDSPPVACQMLGGHWSWWGGWSCG